MGTAEIVQDQSLGQAGWEKKLVEHARDVGKVSPIWVDVPVQGGGHTGVVYVTQDVLWFGESGDRMRMPLSPGAAQVIIDANVQGLFPTKKLASDIARAAAIRLKPMPLQNREANLPQFLQHSKIIDAQLAEAGYKGGLVTGHKKDIVISNRTAPHKVMIYGWFGTYAGQPASAVYTDAYGQKYIQPLSDIHGDYYADYSHGVRVVAPSMIVDGKTMKTEDVYRDPQLSVLVSDEGPIRNPRYPYPAWLSSSPAVGPNVGPVPIAASAPSVYKTGYDVLLHYALNPRGV